MLLFIIKYWQIYLLFLIILISYLTVLSPINDVVTFTSQMSFFGSAVTNIFAITLITVIIIIMCHCTALLVKECFTANCQNI